MTQLIHMISGPRNISTAMMYAFRNRSDTVVVDEPYYGHYLKTTNVDHPGKNAIILSMKTDPVTITEDLLKERQEAYVFAKNMAHHLQGFDYDFLLEQRNIFLIRNPEKLINSFRKVMPGCKAQDIGIIHEADLFKWLEQEGKYLPIVIDSAEVLNNPKKILQQVCRALDIPWEPSMLQWEEGPKPEDGIWAKYWYHSVHQTSSFSSSVTKNERLPQRYHSLLKEVLPAYEYLYEKSIKAS